MAPLSNTEALSLKTGWSEKRQQFAANLSQTQKEKLRDAGALGLERPIAIRAELIDGRSAEQYMREDSSSSSEMDTKIIHFQRHGQGYHNLLGEVWRNLGFDIDIDCPDPSENPFVKPEIRDSPLTETGRKECSDRRHEASMISPEVVVVSPLLRTLQTAQLTFSDHEGRVPWVAHEGCREQLGLLTCNQRRPLSEIMVDFPGVDFGCVETEEDVMWDPHRREAAVEESERIYKFLTEFIRNRPEREIAVVTHSAWLFNMCNAVMDCGEDESLMAWFLTSEIRSMRVSFSDKK
eukprot:CAMPEP_0183290998 /NCGR_PEP_ID=MMETSP0160_2-20130417/559_1 /TAXON_ID=2839 ORGANISM="Odontella Sinensis, Strain Grunow 1884" /NCGR_SAMPLE_ID=MMETSP0160_2 /ASSEMBLY_ACC=CAM_ASM_000250 /LENGTH=292 /DNA_ID=CAMNT_0025451737 /DNA_START=81 /DNA_END=959 /DNA_ORIENTATION=+